MIAVTISSRGSLGRSRLDRGKCLLAWQLCPLQAARETCHLPDLDCSTRWPDWGKEVSKAFGSKASPYKGQPLNSSYVALQKLKAAFKRSVIWWACSDVVWHSLLVAFSAETCLADSRGKLLAGGVCALVCCRVVKRYQLWPSFLACFPGKAFRIISKG